MESEVTGNCHASFGERDEKTRIMKVIKVRLVPTLFSPLLANIALHGMEDYILSHFPHKNVKMNDKQTWISMARLIRYADDLVILHDDLSIIERCKELITEWLKSMGLKLKAEKTRITHTLHEHEGNKGFDFLGFNIRQHPIKGKADNENESGFKTLIKPSKQSIQRHYQNLREIIKAHQSHSQWKLIRKLNPVIRGWSNYFSAVVSKVVYSKLDYLLYLRLRRWAKRRHPKKSTSWIKGKYWRMIANRKSKGGSKTTRSIFTEKGIELELHSDKIIKRHVKVQNRKSPFDGDWIYWSARRGQYPGVSSQFAFLMKTQKGKCTHCGLHFKHGDVIETDHKIPRSKGGKDGTGNLQLLHRHCHDLKTAFDLNKSNG